MSRDGLGRMGGAAVVAMATIAAPLLPASAPAGITGGVLQIYENDSIAIPNGTGAARMNFPTGEVDQASGATIGVRVRHERTQQLELSLKGPNGIKVELSRGDTRGKDLGTGQCADGEPESPSYTTFRDNMSDDISAASAPYVGVYSPREPLSVFNGSLPEGTWKLIVKDTQGGAAGKLLCGLVRVPYSI